MNFDELLAHIKSEGCRVKVWRKKNYIDGSAGTFHVTDSGPIINIATKGEPIKKTMTTLLHEYGHYLQWNDGFLPHIEQICETYDIHYHWIKGNRELTHTEWKAARNTMLWIEWDAEMRGYKKGLELKVEGFDSNYYLKGAIAYIVSIKWSWDNRSDWKLCVPRKYIRGSKPYTSEELFAPLTKAEKAITKRIR